MSVWILLVLVLADRASAQTSAPARVAPEAAASQPVKPMRERFAEARAWLAQPAEETPIEAFAPAAEIRYRRYDTPRPLRVWIAKVDMLAEGVRPVVTAPTDFKTDDDPENDKFETLSQTTLDFARQHGVQLALNTSAFGPLRGKPGEPQDIAGLSASDGRIYSPPHETHGGLFIARDGRVSLNGPPLPQEDLWIAIAGFEMLLDDGRMAVKRKRADTAFGNLNPRTAVGTDKDGRFLWIVTADGRQPERSMGLTLVEMAALFDLLGCYDALNLDGGGSSTFVLQYSDGQQYVVNTPSSGGRLRQVAHNLGIFLPGHGPATQPAGDVAASAPASAPQP